MSQTVIVPITLRRQPGGGFAVRSPELPDLITEGETEQEALANAWDALFAFLDSYDQLGGPIPPGSQAATDVAIEFRLLLGA